MGEAYGIADDKNALMQMNCNVCHRYDRDTKGMGAMPPFGDQLTAQQIADVAAYVVQSTGG